MPAYFKRCIVEQIRLSKHAKEGYAIRPVVNSCGILCRVRRVLSETDLIYYIDEFNTDLNVWMNVTFLFPKFFSAYSNLSSKECDAYAVSRLLELYTETTGHTINIQYSGQTYE